ncbi:MAG: neutral/alkaline non-lysosomal ceramidase N-terminal domain-containing protein, partial [Gemmataceae bacterium]
PLQEFLQMLALTLAALLVTAPPAPLSVGIAQTDITPPVGYRMAGNYMEAFSKGVADPLRAKAIVFQHGETKACIVVTDTCGLARDLTDPIRQGISKELRTPVSNIVVCATHTHGGPMHYDPVFLDLHRSKVNAKSDQDDPHELGQYRKKFVDQTIQAAIVAAKQMNPATLTAGSSNAPGIAFNRRFHMMDGSVRFNPGKLNPGIVRPAGPVDHAVPVVMIQQDGKPVGCFTSFGMHTAVHGGPNFSACYPGHIQLGLQKTYGEKFISVFGEGCAGDINHVNTSTKDKDFDSAAIGTKLAAAITSTALRPIAATLAVKSGTIQVPLRDPRPLDVEKSRKMLLANEGPFLDQVEAYRIVLVEKLRAWHGDTMPLEVQAFQLGEDLAVVTLPHECFMEMGQAIREASPFNQTIVLTLANDIDVYVPTKRAFAEGSYEVTNSPYKAGVGELLVEEATRLLKQLNAKK